MSSAPAVPPLPQGFTNPTSKYSRPPIPPLPPNFDPREESQLAAPMPERAMPSLTADITRTLDDSLYRSPGGLDYRRPSPASSASYGPPYGGGPAPGQVYSPSGFPGGFSRPPSAFQPPRTGPSPAPPSYGGPYTPGGFMPPAATPGYSLPDAMGAVSLGASGAPYAPSPQSQSPSARRPSPAQSQSPPALTAALPTAASLTAAQHALPPLAQAPADHVAWIRDVFFCIDRTVTQQSSPDALHPNAEQHAPPPVVLRAPLPALLHAAISSLLAILASAPSAALQGQPGAAEPHIAEAFYLKGVLYANDPFLPALSSPNPANSSRYSGSHTPNAGGAFADLEHSPRLAFQTFTAAARLGFLPAWFKLGRDYELVGDFTRAKDCFERGAGIPGGRGVVGCLYRLGMAHLLGQLTLSPSPPTALPLLQRAALIATPETPQPAYVYGLILLGEFDRARVSEGVLSGLALIPRASSPVLEARRHIERAAFLGFAPAQYKLGHAYEYAIPPFPFDPLLSVQYYSLASQQGEAEADMSLSKWFLCGAEGAFEKDEALALTFAEKAARKGLASAEFAMGYYAEVGVGGLKDIVLARKWYAKAVSHGNPDAPERLRALSQPAPQSLSRSEHDAITDAKLVRTRTQARINAQKDGRHAPGRQGAADAGTVVQQMKAQARDGAQGGDAHGHGGAHGHGHRHAGAPSEAPARGGVPRGGSDSRHDAAHDHDHDHDHNHDPRPHSLPPLHAQTTPPAAGVGARQPQLTPTSPQMRYSLTDSPAPMGLPMSPAHGRAAGRPPARRSQSVSSMNGGGGSGGGGGRYTASPGGGAGLMIPTSPPHVTSSAAPSPAVSLPPPAHEIRHGGGAGAGAARPAATAGGRGGAATFEEMGFKTGKAEEKDCVIM